MSDAFLEHAIPGRMRIRIRSRRGDKDFFASLVHSLREVEDVKEVVANPHTGSVLVFHSGEADAVARVVAPEGLSRPRSVGRSIIAGRAAGPLAKNTPSIQALTLLIGALVQGARGQVLGSASEQFWHATRAREMRAPAMVIGLVGLGLVQLMRGRLLAPASSLLMYAMMSQAGRH
jgi:Heavy metal associated domain 2